MDFGERIKRQFTDQLLHAYFNTTNQTLSLHVEHKKDGGMKYISYKLLPAKLVRRFICTIDGNGSITYAEAETHYDDLAKIIGWLDNDEVQGFLAFAREKYTDVV